MTIADTSYTNIPEDLEMDIDNRDENDCLIPKDSIISDDELGVYAIEDYRERKYAAIYYSIRNLQGLVLKHQYGEAFDWDSYKVEFETIFGLPDKGLRVYSIDSLLEYAQRKFNMNFQELIAYNKRGFERRQEWEVERAINELPPDKRSKFQVL